MSARQKQPRPEDLAKAFSQIGVSYRDRVFNPLVDSKEKWTIRGWPSSDTKQSRAWQATTSERLGALLGYAILKKDPVAIIELLCNCQLEAISYLVQEGAVQRGLEKYELKASPELRAQLLYNEQWRFVVQLLQKVGLTNVLARLLGYPTISWLS